MKKLTYEDLIEKIGRIVNDAELLLRVQGNIICIEGKYFSYSVLNRMQRILQLYGECEWWILTSENISDGVMYKIRIFKILTI